MHPCQMGFHINSVGNMDGELPEFSESVDWKYFQLACSCEVVCYDTALNLVRSVNTFIGLGCMLQCHIRMTQPTYILYTASFCC